MSMPKLALGLSGQYGLSAGKQMELYRDAGFDGIFFSCELGDDISGKVRAAEKYGMVIGSLHAPFMRCDAMWHESDKTEAAVEELIYTVRACGEFDVPVAVMHAFIGFDRHEPTKAGIRNFSRVVEEAERLGVKVAFENTEGEEYLDALMEHFKDSTSVGFCYDTGHGICYTPERDLLRDYGDRLAYVHVNDNLGVCGDAITWLDDLHLLPYDGACDFDSVAGKLGELGFCDTLSFELSTKSKPGRHENDAYGRMPVEEYLALAYERAARFAREVEIYAAKK
ncbi:MAG: sugar phosphate isomerase/epimerase [Clostridia bacterium]|nr:sugar phosphate isomerase/epimerase [Clostridia bacterium]